jgi:membrane associated rhomboid family serine protease
MENTNSNINGLLGLAIFILFIAIFYAGAAKKIVIYYDSKDLFTSVGALITPLMIYVLLQEEKIESETAKAIIYYILIPILGLFSLFLLYLNFKNGVFHNKNISIGLLVGLFKLVYVVLAFAVILAQFSNAKDKRKSFGDIIVAALIVGLAIWITNVLVNGKEVYKQKGWTLPVTN